MLPFYYSYRIAGKSFFTFIDFTTLIIKQAGFFHNSNTMFILQMSFCLGIKKGFRIEPLAS